MGWGKKLKKKVKKVKKVVKKSVKTASKVIDKTANFANNPLVTSMINVVPVLGPLALTTINSVDQANEIYKEVSDDGLNVSSLIDAVAGDDSEYVSKNNSATVSAKKESFFDQIIKMIFGG